MLIKKDVNTIREVIKEELKDFRGEMEDTFITKDDLKTSLSELKSDFFKKIDPILKETVTNREERIINDERISKLEQTVFQ